MSGKTLAGTANAVTTWYQPSTGLYAVHDEVGAGSFAVYDGRDFAEGKPAQFGVASGSEGFLRSFSAPLLGRGTATLFYDEWKRGFTPSPDFSIRASLASDHTRLRVHYVMHEDTSSTPFNLTIDVGDPVSPSTPALARAFALPTGQPTYRVVQHRPGTRPVTPLPGWWFGPSWDGRTAVTTIEWWATAGAPDAWGWHDHNNEYLTVYRPGDSSGLAIEPGRYPYPGLGNIPSGDVYVAAQPKNTRLIAAPTQRIAIRLADGTPATYIRLGELTAGVFYVRTANAVVQVSYSEATTRTDQLRLARQLQPAAG
jgi:hypothetical protein